MLYVIYLWVLGKYRFTKIIKEALFVSKTINNTGMVRKIYDSLCVENFNKTYAMLLYSPTRWTTVNLMIRRLLKVRTAITLMHHSVLNEREQRGIVKDFNLPICLLNIINSSSFWSELKAASEIFDQISSCIVFLESDSCTLSDAYASFIYVRHNISTSSVLNGFENSSLDTKLIRRWNRIYSPIHALALFCDPLYIEMRDNFSSIHGSDFLNFGNGDIIIQCQTALKK